MTFNGIGPRLSSARRVFQTAIAKFNKQRNNGFCVYTKPANRFHLKSDSAESSWVSFASGEALTKARRKTCVTRLHAIFLFSFYQARDWSEKSHFREIKFNETKRQTTLQSAQPGELCFYSTPFHSHFSDFNWDERRRKRRGKKWWNERQTRMHLQK